MQTTTMMEMVAGRLKVNIFETRVQLGEQAARDVAEKIKALLLSKSGFINMIFAAAPSQNELLYFLSIQEGIDWSRINGFHMDEYIGVEKSARQSFAYFLKENIFDKVPFNKVYYIHGKANNPDAECLRYTDLLN